MSKVKKIKQQARIVEKYLTGELDETQSSDLKAALTNTPDTGKAWNRLHGRLAEEGLIPDRSMENGGRFVKPILLAAASLIILAGIAAIIVMFVGRGNAAEEKHLLTGTNPATLVKTMPDGSVVYLAGNTQLTYPERFDAKVRKVSLEGEAFFDITRNPGKPFLIETGKVMVEVIGTSFNVRTGQDGEFHLWVKQGTVKVSLKGEGRSGLMVMAGEEVEYHSRVLVKSKLTESSGTGWYYKQMHFKDETLKDILHVLNLNYQTNFVLDDTLTGKRRLTATFSNEPAETMAELLCVALNLNHKTINGAILLYDKTQDPGR